MTSGTSVLVKWHDYIEEEGETFYFLLALVERALLLLGEGAATGLGAAAFTAFTACCFPSLPLV